MPWSTLTPYPAGQMMNYKNDVCLGIILNTMKLFLKLVSLIFILLPALPVTRLGAQENQEQMNTYLNGTTASPDEHVDQHNRIEGAHLY